MPRGRSAGRGDQREGRGKGRQNQEISLGMHHEIKTGRLGEHRRLGTTRVEAGFRRGGPCYHGCTDQLLPLALRKQMCALCGSQDVRAGSCRHLLHSSLSGTVNEFRMLSRSAECLRH